MQIKSRNVLHCNKRDTRYIHTYVCVVTKINKMASKNRAASFEVFQFFETTMMATKICSVVRDV